MKVQKIKKNRYMSLKQSKLHCAIVAVMATWSGSASGAMLEEVIVTATKRAESAQNVAMTVQAIDEKTIAELNIGDFEDYIRYLPGVTSAGRGPGRNNIYIRGASVGKGGVKIAGAIGSEPNVALYLDETPISIGGRNIDIYMADMSRVEVLPGPQGTLFGASSQAGTVRLISNKPDIDHQSASFKIGYETTSNGEPGTSTEAYVNLPLIEGKLATRVVVYNTKEGGYIDNIPGSKVINNPSASPDNAATIYNSQVAEDNFNDSHTSGIRLGLKYQVNEDWDILFQHLSQELESEGVWDYDPELGDLEVRTYMPDNAEDTVNLNSLNVTGQFASLELVYAGSFLDREVEAVQDYTGYADSGPWIPYYICSYPGYATCGTPNLFVNQFFGVERQTHELRLTSDKDRRLRFIAGIFADDYELTERGDWNYPASIEQGFAPNAPIAGATASNPHARDPGVTFFNDFIRTKKETSFFGEVEYDIGDSVTLSVGARRYSLELDLKGSSNFANRGEADLDWGRNVDEVLEGIAPSKQSDTILKLNLEWQVNDKTLLYGTWSEGYRPGGFNRNGGAFDEDAPDYVVPSTYESDELINREIGWKTQWLDDRLRFNGAIYSIEWSNMQISTLNFDISNITFIDNAGTAESQGVEMDTVWLATDNLSLFFNLSYNDTSLVKAPAQIASQISPMGSPLALAPELQFTLRGRYEWDLKSGSSIYTQLAYQHTDETVNSIVLEGQFQQDSYATLDFATGYEKDNWSVKLFAENLTDERAELYISDEDVIVKTTTNRPRTIGLSLTYQLE